jgi:acyl-coenzyme A synthetase/AMP-(fatty) acid ligase
MHADSELLVRLRAACRDHAARPALWGAGRTRCYGELAVAIDAWAAALGAGARGRTILLRLKKDPARLAVLFFACVAAGAVPALADPAWGADECRALAARYGCTQWIGDEAWPGDSEVRAGDGDGAPLFTQLLPVDAGVPALHPACCFIRFSSGSTGVPRAIEFSAAGALAIAAAWSHAAALGAGDRILCYATLNNGLAFNTTLLPGLLAGACVRVEAAFLTARAVLAAARELQPTLFVAFPLVYELLARLPVDELRAGFGGTRLRLSSASALAPAVQSAWADRHGLPIGNYYGIAEVGPVTFNDGSDATGMGALLPGAVVQLADPEVPGGRSAVRTPWMALRYVRTAAPDAGTPALQAGEPYATSDRIAFDAAGRIALRGRSDDVVNLNGRKVSLGALREALAPVMEGAEFAVVPDHDATGTWLCVHVEAPHLSTQQIQAACARVLPPHAVPRRVVLHRSFPRSSAGKVLLARLQAQDA